MTLPFDARGSFDPASGEVSLSFVLPTKLAPPVLPDPEPVLALQVLPNTTVPGRLDATWKTDAAELVGWRIDRDQPAGARVGPWGTDLPAEARSQRFTLLDPLEYTVTLVGKLRDGREVRATAKATPTSEPAPEEPAPSPTPHLPFDRAPRVAGGGRRVLGHVMPNWTLSDDDEGYDLRLLVDVESKARLGTLGYPLAYAGYSHRARDTDRLWTWTGTAWVDQGPCMAYKGLPVGTEVPNPRNYWVSSVLPPGKAEKAVHGGDSRDRPLPIGRHGGTTREYRRAQAKQVLRWMWDRGFDVATIHSPQIGASSVHWPRSLDYVRACEELITEGVDMRVVLMLDCTTSAMSSVRNADGTVNLNASADAAAAALLTVADSPALWREDGRVVYMPFGPELDPAGVTITAAQRLGMHKRILDRIGPAYFLAQFLQAAIPLLDAGWVTVVDEVCEWGPRTPAGAQSDSERNRRLVSAALRRGVQASIVVAHCDLRPRQGRGWERGGFRLLDETMNTLLGRHGGAAPRKALRAHVVTIDDYPEGSHFAPSVYNGHALLDYLEYDLQTFITGSAPKIVRPKLFMTLRSQFWDDPANPMTFTGGAPAGQLGPITKQTLMIKPVGGAPVQEVDVRAFAPIKGYALQILCDGIVRWSGPVSPGRSGVAVPLRVGRWSARLVHDAEAGPDVEVVAKHEVVRTAAFQDLQPYHYAS